MINIYNPPQLKRKLFFFLSGLLSLTTALNAQNTYTFTTCSATGSAGPSQAQQTSAYAATNLSVGTTCTAGIQYWVVPATGPYRIEAKGAKGGNGAGQVGGAGASMRGDFTLTAGSVIKILVGQMGLSRVPTDANSTGAGGGGSFVTYTTNVPLVVAGGGGGSGQSQAGLSGTTSLNGTSSGGSSGLGGIDGGGGGAGLNGTAGTSVVPGGVGSSCSYGSGGGGFYTRGGYNCNGTGALIAGESFTAGGLGGPADPGTSGVAGGFGGGGGNGHRSPGGGGWSGGAGDGGTNGGGGGGSYNAGTNQVNTSGANNADGVVIITQLCIPGAAPTNTTAAANQNICQSNSTTLTVVGSGTLNWYATPVSTVVLGTGSVYTTPTLAAGVYTYYAAATNTCAEGSRTPISVTVNANPTLAIAGGTAGVCPGSAITLTASGADSYTWNTGSNSTTIAPTPTANATYSVVGTTSVAGCSGTANFSVTVLAAPSLSVTGAGTICTGGQSATLTASGATSYSWSNGSTSVTIVVTPTATAVYTVTGTWTTNVCTSSLTAQVVVSPCTAIENNLSSLELVKIYPNPSNGAFSVILPVEANLRIYNISGQLIYSAKLNAGSNSISLTDLAKGIYQLEFSNDNDKASHRVIKD